MDKEVLEVWLGQKGSAPKLIGEFRAALNDRNWPAHGRYRKPKPGKEYVPLLVQNITVGLMSALSIR